MRIYNNYKEENRVTIRQSDCINLLKRMPDESVDLIITSPPYCMKKAYENPEDDIETFKKQHLKILPDIYRILKAGGSICWQIGYHVSDKCIIPLDYDSLSQALGVMKKYSGADELTQAMVQELIDKVIVTDPEHVEIVWKFKDEVRKFIGM